MGRLIDGFTNLTSEQFRNKAESGLLGDGRVELRRGIVVALGPQYVPHASVKQMILLGLWRALQSTTTPDLRADTETSVSFGDGFEPLPDIILWRGLENPLAHHGPIPADRVTMCVEISAASLADDLGEKLQDYASAGLQEYWVADVANRVLLQHSAPQPREYARRDVHLFGARIPLRTLPELVVQTQTFG